jgi:hypothetical protein
MRYLYLHTWKFVFLEELPDYSNLETQNLSISGNIIPIYDLCDYTFYDFLVHFKLRVQIEYAMLSLFYCLFYTIEILRLRFFRPFCSTPP